MVRLLPEINIYSLWLLPGLKNPVWNLKPQIELSYNLIPWLGYYQRYNIHSPWLVPGLTNLKPQIKLSYNLIPWLGYYQREPGLKILVWNLLPNIYIF